MFLFVCLFLLDTGQKRSHLEANSSPNEIFRHLEVLSVFNTRVEKIIA